MALDQNLSAHLFIISAASGTGKTTLCRYLERELGWFFSISATTRPPRPGETNSQDYFFISDEEFDRRVRESEFLEWEKVHGHRYGTPKKPIEDQLNTGKNVLLDLDTQGAIKLKRTYPNVVLIFIEPPSLEILRQRLQDRGTDSAEVIDRRIQRASEEIAFSDEYDYIVINKDLEVAKQDLKKILLSFA